MSVSSTVSIEVVKWSEMKPYQKMRGHTGSVRGVAHLPNGQHIITCSSDASLRLWDRESGTQIGSNWQDDGDQAPVLTIALSPNGKTIASGSEDGTVKLWDIEMKKVTAKWTGHTNYVLSVHWSADGMRVASGSGDGTVRVWEMESGETVLGPIQTGNHWVRTVYSPDSSNIATGGDKAIEIWDTTTGERLSTLEQDSEVWSLAWTSDQKKLIVGFENGSIRIFNPATWEQIAILEGHTSYVDAISLLQNDRLLASASEDDTAHLWNLDTNLPVGPPLQHEGGVGDAALSADGKFLVTACEDKNAYVWNTHTILEEAGLEDLLSLPNPVAHVKSILNADATRRPKKLNVIHATVPRGFFDEAQDSAPSSTPRTDAMVNTDPLNVDPPSSTTHTDPASSALPHRHALALVSGARALLSRILPRFLQSQPNTDQSTDPQQHSGQPVISIHLPAHVEVAAVQPDAPEHLAQLEEPPLPTQSRGIFGRARDYIHSFSTRSHPPFEHRRHHTSSPFSGSPARPPLGRFPRRFRLSQYETNEPSQLQQRLAQPIMLDDDPTNVQVPDGRGNQSDAVPLAPPRPSHGYSDDTRDHIHSTTHLPSSLHPPRHNFIPSSRSDAHTVIGRFSQRFRRSHPNTDPPIELQSRPTRNVVSDHRPTVVEVPEIRDKQALYVAPQPVRHNRRQKNTWLARFFLFICCEPRVNRDAGGSQ